MRRLIIALCVLLWVIVFYTYVVQAQQAAARIEYAAVYPDNSLLIHVSVPLSITEAAIVADSSRQDLQVTDITASQVRWLLVDGGEGMLNFQPAAQTAATEIVNATPRDIPLGLIIYGSELTIYPPTSNRDTLNTALSTYAATANTSGCLWDALAAVSNSEHSISEANRVLLITAGLASQRACQQSEAPAIDFPVDVVAFADNVDSTFQEFINNRQGHLEMANVRTFSSRVQDVISFWSNPLFMLRGELDTGATGEVSLVMTLSDETTVTLPLMPAASPFPAELITPTATATLTPTEVLATLPPAATNTALPTSTATDTPTATATFTWTPTATASDTPTATASETYTPSATFTNTPTPTFTETATWTPTATATHTPTPTDEPTVAVVVIVPTPTPTATVIPTPPDTLTALADSIARIDPLILGGIALVVIGAGLAIAFITRPRRLVAQPVTRATSFYENLDTQIGSRSLTMVSAAKDDDDIVVTAAIAEEQLQKMIDESFQSAIDIVAWLRLNTPVPQYFEVHPEGAVIGRSKECQIVIKGDLFVSRQHARLRVENRDVFIEKLSTRNPVLVNRVSITDAQKLNSYDVIQLSQTTQLIFIANTKAESHD